MYALKSYGMLTAYVDGAKRDHTQRHLHSCCMGKRSLDDRNSRHYLLHEGRNQHTHANASAKYQP